MHLLFPVVSNFLHLLRHDRRKLCTNAAKTVVLNKVKSTPIAFNDMARLANNFFTVCDWIITSL